MVEISVVNQIVINHGVMNRAKTVCFAKRSSSAEPTPEDMVGKINPREPELIQELRRKLRLGGRAWNTEVAYVRWVRLAYRKPIVLI